MPKLYEYLGIAILFYSNEHEPVHVHGKFQGCESKAELLIEEGAITEIRICEVRGRKPLPPAQLREFARFAEAFKAEIVQKWVDYFVYHRQLKCIKIEGRIR